MNDLNFHQMVENLPAGVLKTTLDGKILYVNPALARMLEFNSPDELLGKSVLTRWQDPEGRSRYISELKQHGHINNYEAEIVTNTGKNIHTLISANLEGDLISSMIIDITERKALEDELRLHSEIFKEIIEGFYVIRAVDGVIVFTNPAFEKIFGYAPNELIGKNFSIVNAPTDKNPEEIAAEIIAALDKTGKWQGEILNRKKDGSKFWCYATVTNFDHPEHGKVWVAVHTDITERKKSEEALQESKALLDDYFALAPVAMGYIDTDMRYLKLNQALANINGRSIEDHIHKRPREILPGQLGLDVEKKFESVMRTGQAIVNEEISGEISSQPGVIRHFAYSYFPIYRSDKSLIGLGVTLIEITKIKKVEEQLRQSQKMEALGTLSGGIAHDFNNILYPILINANLLLNKSEAGSEDYEMLSDIVDSTDRAKDLVSHILHFSRHRPVDKIVCNLTQVISEAVKLVRAAIPESIAIEENYPADPVTVICDSSQIYQVLVNLCTNAEQAITYVGKISISLEALEIENLECFGGTNIHGNYARLSITDSGLGMDNETISKIFDPFFTTRKAGEGTGLGLSTVFGSVHGNGGGIVVSSKPGEGSTFDVFLPLAEGITESLANTTEIVGEYKGTENILFVDDQESIRKNLKICLEQFGYNVTVAGDGHQALALFSDNPDHFDLVITDQTMPGMPGASLARELQRFRPDLPIILCTGYSDSITPESSKILGISTFLYKPIEPVELGRTVRKVLDRG